MTTYPALHQDLGDRRRSRTSPRRGFASRRRMAAESSLSAAVFDVYRGEQVGEGRKSLALRLEFRAADRTLTDADVAESPAGDRARRSRRSEGCFVADPRVLVAGASGFAGALAAQLVLAPPEPGAGLDQLPQRRRDAALPSSTLATGCRWCSPSSTRLAARGGRGPHRLPARRGGARGSALRSRGVRVVDLSADFRLRDMDIYTRWYGDTARRSCSGKPSTGSPSSTETSSGVPSWPRRRAVIRPRRCSLSRRWPSAA